MDIQTTVELAKSVEWYWIAAGALAVGAVAGSSITQGIKSWRADHLEKPMLPSEVRLTGRITSGIASAVAWIGAGIVQTGNCDWAPAIALFVLSFLTSNIVWDMVVEPVLKAVAPKIAEKL